MKKVKRKADGFEEWEGAEKVEMGVGEGVVESGTWKWEQNAKGSWK